MYAQLCLKLNQLAPNFEEPGNQTTTFRRLLLHKCQEEFERRRQATAAFDRQDGLTPEEEKQRAVAKRKMLGNIRFVGELFKLGMLHEAIIHSCIKELLERKRNQSIEDTSKSIECLCHFMTTVGQKLDTEKAKGWMDKYFDRMQSLSTNKDQPPRIHFMLLGVIELRQNDWLPRRLVGSAVPRPIHEIRQEAYQEMKPPPRSHSAPTAGGGGGGRHHSHHPGPIEIPVYQSHTAFRGPHAPYFPPPPGGDEGFLSSPPSHKDSLLSPQDPDSIISPFHPPPHSSSSNELQPGGAVGGTPVGGTPGERLGEKKQPRKLPSGKSDEKVSLRPAMAILKHGSSRPSSSPFATNPPPTSTSSSSTSSSLPANHVTGSGRGKAGDRQSPLLRTRDDSSDEEGPPNRRGGGAQMPHPQGMGPPLTNYPHLPPGTYPGPPPHMIHLGRPGVPPYFPHRPPLMHPPPHNMPMQHHRPMMHGPPPLGHVMPPGGPRGLFPHHPPPPGQYFGPPFHRGGPMPPPHLMYGSPRPLGPLGPPQWPPGVGGPPHSGSAHLGSATRPEGGTRPLPPGLERNESAIPMVRKVVSRSKKGSQRKTEEGGGKSEHERAMEPVIDQFLRTLDIPSAVAAIKRLEGITKETLCTLLITMTLEKSEDDRTHVSDLMAELHATEVIAGDHFLQALNTIMSSIEDYEKDLPQCKPYIAGFVARAISKEMVKFADVVPTFKGGTHHPTVLVILQALLSLIGEEKVLHAFQEGGVKLSLLLPLSMRSHDHVSELMEAKNLGFLYPLKRIQAELATHLKQEASAVAVYKWIKNNVDQSFYCTPEFVTVLTRCILDHVTRGSSLALDVKRTENPPRDVLNREKELMTKFKVLVQKFVNESVPLQISTLYATQVFCHDLQFPKGLLLRLFSYWYDLDVVEEEAFLLWKEDITQEHPGKGQALFQVNQWLVLLAEAEDEEESDEETTH